MFDTATKPPDAAIARDAAAGRASPGPVGPSILAAAATLVAMWPYTGVIMSGVWTFVVVTVIVVVAIAGIIGRIVFARLRDGIQDLLTLLLQVFATAMACTAMLVSETALYGVIPTPTSVRLIGLRMQQAIDEIATGVAPIAASVAMATALGLLFAVVAILVDHLVSHRLIILTVLFTSLLGVLPMLISFGAVNMVWFLMQSVMILLVLRFGARHDRRSPSRSSYLVASAAGIAVIALTIVATPVLPMGSALPGTGPTLTVRADLRLGDDLRRPESIEALTLVTSGSTAPYLRLATLSRFDGEIWRPDRTDRQPLARGFGEREWDEDIDTIERRVSIRVLGVSSDRLPVPYAAERVSGVDADWRAVPFNRTVASSSLDAAGADYTVRTATAAPTLEQVRASSAANAGRVAPPAEDLPAIIGETAREVTAGANTDYDKLLTLQDWFRSEFSYSLEAPVEEGFDGTGADAVATFLEQRTGYCVHFAGAFALMAQTLDMPVRIVVGYLPGVATDQRRDDDIVYSVSSDQLHSWPEVYFTGIGWVPFEPTATLGTPTDFASEAAGGGSGESPELPEPSASPSATTSEAPTGGPDRLDEQSIGDQQLQTLNPMPVLLTALGILIVVLLPALVRAGLRMQRFGRARQGDAMAAWRELADTMADLGLTLHDADTARTRAERLVTEHDADREAMDALVRAVERRSYARPGEASDAGDLATPLRTVLAQLPESVDGRRRITARMLPASLFHRVRIGELELLGKR
ncbi:transglutaminase family protein [Microbacterium alcoholitolerans]|uniref:transglutaminase family protein n=1 Tax=unclassified Microbacterium TaxID=2609290 RepID=UPI003D172C98